MKKQSQKQRKVIDLRKAPRIYVSASQLRAGMRLCIENIEHLLSATLAVSKSDANASHALGLYTFAVEEFGKLYVMKNARKYQGKGYALPQFLFGSRFSNSIGSHDLKFVIALRNLPKQCTRMSMHYKMRSALAMKVKVLDPDNPRAYTQELPIGFNVIAKRKLPVYLNARLSCFYVDWDENTKKWKVQYFADATNLEKAVAKFKEVLKSYTPQTTWPV